MKSFAKKPFFAVITTCYNSEKTIERTILSVLQQTYDTYHYYLVDGSSSDRTVEIIKRYQEMYPEKITYVSERDKGIYDGINKGIRMALDGGEADLIGLVNSDDYYEPDALEKMAEAYVKDSPDSSDSDAQTKALNYTIYYGMIKIIEDGKERMTVMNHHDFLPEKMITHPSCFVTSALYRDLGLYSLEYKSASDYDFMLRMFGNEKVRFVPVYQVISNFSQGGISGSKLGDHEAKMIRHKYGYLSDEKYFLHMLSYYLRFWRK